MQETKLTSMTRANNNISKKIIVYILLFSSVITLALTFIQLNLNYRYDVNLIEQRFEQIKLTNVNSITQKVWTLNETGLQSELESILKLPDITFIEFKPAENEKKPKSLGHTDTHFISHTIPITYRYRDNDIELGELFITASLSNVYQRLIDTALIILLTQGLKTFFVSFFIFLLFRNLLTRHLSKIVSFIEDKNIISKNQLLKLDRKESKLTQNDELDIVTRSINKLITNMRQVISTLRTTQQKLYQAQELSNTAYWEYDPEHQIFHLNPQSNKLLGIDHDVREVSLNNYLNLVMPSDRSHFLNQLYQAEQHHHINNFEIRILSENQSYKTFFQEIKSLHTGSDTPFLLGSMQDVSKLVEHQQKLEYLANTDTLTTLPNRNNFHVMLEKRLEKLKTDPSKPFAVLMADLNRFKEINDALGHYAGDQLLKEIGPRFKAILGKNNHVARLGGDEFAFMIEGNTSAVENFVSQILKTISEPFKISNIQLSIGISVGASLAPKQSNSATDLMRYADIAMYHAKRKRIGFQIYTDETNVHGVRRLELMADIRTALATDQMTLFYQPKVTLSHNGLTCQGVEALIRWNHPVYGLIPPDEFIPFAEMSDLIGPLSLWVIEKAIKDLKQIHPFREDCVASLNISSRNLHDVDFPKQVEALLAKNQIDAHRFILEITESTIMEDPKQAELSIIKLANMGFKISIDDFGTGYSSLAYLKNLPVNELKIDRAFVKDMIEDESDYTIVKSTIDLAHNLGLTVTAEGVENAETEKALLNLECDIAQGYYYSRPLPLDEFLEWIHNLKTSDCSIS